MKLSILKKTIIMIIVFAMSLIVSSTGMFARVVHNLNAGYYTTRATDISKTLANTVNSEQLLRLRDKVLEVYEKTENKVPNDMRGSGEWSSYTGAFSEIEQDEDFLQLRDFIRRVQDVNSVERIYVVCIDAENKYTVRIADGAYENVCPPGSIDRINEIDGKVLEDPEYGFPADAENAADRGGLVTAGIPIYQKGQIVAYAMTDISMDEVNAAQAKSVWKLFGYLIAGMALISFIGILVVNNILVKPIKKLTRATEIYSEKGAMEDSTVFSELRIRTGDELVELAESMKHMETEINNKITELITMDDQLTRSRSVANEMKELANKDALTGVGNKTAYDSKVKKLEALIKTDKEAEFGIVMIDLNYLKTINDKFGHKSGDVAITRLCGIICDVFAHSPVYRIGGDEFAVILQNKDYERAEELIASVNKTIDDMAKDASLSPEEKVSAAVGFAKYNKTEDKSFNDVFKRADKAMYARKKQMKAER